MKTPTASLATTQTVSGTVVFTPTGGPRLMDSCRKFGVVHPGVAVTGGPSGTPRSGCKTPLTGVRLCPVAGVYTYICTVHPAMTNNITVAACPPSPARPGLRHRLLLILPRLDAARAPEAVVKKEAVLKF